VETSLKAIAKEQTMSDNKKQYTNFGVHKNEFHPNKMDTSMSDRLPPGMYKVKVIPMLGRLWFESFDAKSDSLVELPSAEYSRIVAEMDLFLKPETMKKFQDKGFLYKRSALLHGLPGTGKTCIVNRVSQQVIKRGGVCLFVENPQVLPLAFEVLESVQPDVLTMVVLEEVDSMIAHGNESSLLSILDGEIQKQNVMYLATTNYIDKIPARMRRPGRFSSVIEVKYPTPEARSVYLQTKLGREFPRLGEWVEKTSGLSIDELKECVQAVELLESPLDEVVGRLRETRGDNSEYESKGKRRGNNLVRQFRDNEDSYDDDVMS
jgi:hypothetical protein